MEWWVVGVLVFIAFGVVGPILKRMGNPAEEVPLERIPADARAEIDRILPEFRPDGIRLTRNGSHAYLEGDHQGARARVKAEFHQPAGLTELEFNAVSGARSRRRISREELPAGAVGEVERVLGDDLAAFDWYSVTGGTLDGEGNYEVEGTANDWKWEIEVTESGRLLEFEKERRRR